MTTRRFLNGDEMNIQSASITNGPRNNRVNTRLTAGILIAIAFLLLLFPSRVHAQAMPVLLHPHPLVFADYMTSQPGNSGEWLYGFNSTVELRTAHIWGIRADSSGQHWGIYDTRYFGGAGPELVFTAGPVRLHVEALAGGGRYRQFGIPGSSGDPVYCLAIRGGGGADVRISRRWIARLGEVNETRFFSSHGPKTLAFSQGVGLIF
jgi:hypothetical protein